MRQFRYDKDFFMEDDDMLNRGAWLLSSVRCAGSSSRRITKKMQEDGPGTREETSLKGKMMNLNPPRIHKYL